MTEFPTFCVGVLHASHVEWRRRNLTRMYNRLTKFNGPMCAFSREPLSMFVGKGDTAIEYFEDLHARRVSWARETGTSHWVFLDDDLIISPHFWDNVRAMVQAKPNAIIGLHSNHPDAPADARWYRTNAWVCGAAYILPRKHALSFKHWDDASYVSRMFDSQLNEWITHGGGPKEVWHPNPAPIQHMCRESLVGHDGDSYERTIWYSEERCEAGWDVDGPMLALPTSSNDVSCTQGGPG